MNYTTNYHLPQWVESDRILMEDFNGAMTNIDQGLGNARRATNSIKTTAYNLSEIMLALKENGTVPGCKGLAGDNLSDTSGFMEVPYGYSYDATEKRLQYSSDSMTGDYQVTSTATNITKGGSGSTVVWIPEKKGHTEKIRFLATCSGVISFYFTITCNGAVTYTSQTYYQTGNWQYTDMPEVTFDFLPGQSYQFHVYNTSTDSTITALNGFQIYFTEKASIPVIDSQPKVIGCDAESAVAWIHYTGICPKVSLLVNDIAYPMTITGEAVSAGTEETPEILCQQFSADVSAESNNTAALRFTAQGNFDLYRWNLWMY